MYLYVIRHAQSLENIHQASSANCELSQLGFKQAQRIATFFEKVDVSHIFCSPFTRTIQTGTPLSHMKGKSIVLIPELSEVFMEMENVPSKSDYQWETCDEITSAFPHTCFSDRHQPSEAWWPESYPETGINVYERVKRFYENELSALFSTNEHVVVFAHCATAACLRKILNPVCDIDMPNAVIYQHELTSEGKLVDTKVESDFLGEVRG